MVITMRLRQNGRHFTDSIFKCIFLNENVWIPNNISLKFVPKRPINNFPALVQIMAWHHPGDMPLFEPMKVSLPMHTCVTRPQWVKTFNHQYSLLHCKGKLIILTASLSLQTTNAVRLTVFKAYNSSRAVAKMTFLFKSYIHTWKSPPKSQVMLMTYTCQRYKLYLCEKILD